jgi:hypothetical protein
LRSTLGTPVNPNRDRDHTAVSAATSSGRMKLVLKQVAANPGCAGHAEFA